VEGIVRRVKRPGARATSLERQYSPSDPKGGPLRMDTKEKGAMEYYGVGINF